MSLIQLIYTSTLVDDDPAVQAAIFNTTKKTVISAPACVKFKPNSGISHGKSVGSSRWKKCEVPWASPTNDMVG